VVDSCVNEYTCLVTLCHFFCQSSLEENSNQRPRSKRLWRYVWMYGTSMQFHFLPVKRVWQWTCRATALRNIWRPQLWNYHHADYFTCWVFEGLDDPVADLDSMHLLNHNCVQFTVYHRAYTELYRCFHLSICKCNLRRSLIKVFAN